MKATTPIVFALKESICRRVTCCESNKECLECAANNYPSVMPGCVPHWVLGTSNAICVGRHFYSSASICSSVIGVVHTFLLNHVITNADHVKTRTLLFQLMVFWSMKLDKNDVDGELYLINAAIPESNFIIGIGAHIPDLSSEVEFFDVIFLGIFVILSRAFDRRFYNAKVPPNLDDEASCAVAHFKRILDVFSQRFFILLERKVVAHFYVFDRMLGEFAAASVVFAKALHDNQDKDYDDGSGENGVTYEMFRESIEDILKDSHAEVFPYYSHCLDRHHKHFLWTGPELQIFPRSEEFDNILSLSVCGGVLDLPSHLIYDIPLHLIHDLTLDSTPLPPAGKRHDRGDSSDEADKPLRKRRL